MRPSIFLKNLQTSFNWRAQYNPLRGLTLPLLVALLEAGERGDYARLQWLYRFIEKRNPTLRAVLQRRQGSLTKLDWDVRTAPGAGRDPRALAARQAAALRAAYQRVENLREAVTFLALAEFRGYAHLERHVDAQGRTVRLEPVPQWFWARLGPEAPWQYNATARPGLPMPGDPVLDPARFLYREVLSPVDEIAAIAHVRQALSQKDWDAFVETYGLPPLFLELPPDIPPERETEYQAQAEAIIGDARGTVPHGTGIHTVDSGARGQNPFAEHLRYQDELIVLAATGGKLTALTESGSGTLAGGAHQQAFDDLAEAEAATICDRAVWRACDGRAVLAGKPAAALGFAGSTHRLARLRIDQRRLLALGPGRSRPGIGTRPRQSRRIGDRILCGGVSRARLFLGGPRSASGRLRCQAHGDYRKTARQAAGSRRRPDAGARGKGWNGRQCSGARVIEGWGATAQAAECNAAWCSREGSGGSVPAPLPGTGIGPVPATCRGPNRSSNRRCGGSRDYRRVQPGKG